jgi:hypothetical protein
MKECFVVKLVESNGTGTMSQKEWEDGETMDNTIGYRKHNIYLGNYEVDQHGILLDISEDSQYVVKKYMGNNEYGGVFNDSSQSIGKVCIILQDLEKDFWSVISFLDPDEAIELGRELIQFGESCK